jgi:apolipoprotein D and lipocalin family protein
MCVWYEIASFPQFFQQGLVGVTAEYTLEDDGRVRVLNSGFRNSLEGAETSILGYATVVDATTNSKLRVRFDIFPANLFPGDYWIIEVGDNYEYAVVSDPTRQTLWILSRTPSMDTALYDDIVSWLATDGFDTERLVMTLQDTSV